MKQGIVFACSRRKAAESRITAPTLRPGNQVSRPPVGKPRWSRSGIQRCAQQQHLSAFEAANQEVFVEGPVILHRWSLG